MVDRAEASDPRLLEILRSHPRVASVIESDEPFLAFEQGEWKRRVLSGEPSVQLAGLVELMDNNPLVCAAQASVPDPVSTLALIALGPLIRASLLVEAATMLVNFQASPDIVDGFLAKESWNQGLTLSYEPVDLGSVIAATVIAAIHTPPRLEDLDDLYQEAYSRSFFVRREEESPWDTQLVQGKPHAVFRLRVSPGDDQSLLTIQLMADKTGKCGPSQIIHCMNVMAGLEETLGIAGD